MLALLQQPVDRALMSGLVDPYVADLVQPPVTVALRCLQGRRPLAGQAVPLDVLHAGLRLPLRLPPPGFGSDGLEAPVVGEGEKGGVEHDLIRPVLQHRRLHVVHQDRGRHATRLLEGLLEGAEEGLLGFADGELEEAPARVAEHVDEAVQPGPPAFVLDMVLGLQPVGLGLLAGPGLETRHRLHTRLPTQSPAGELDPLVAAFITLGHDLP